MLQVSWRFVGTYGVGISRGCLEGVAVKADALALTPRSCAFVRELRKARGVHFYATNGDVGSGDHR